MNKVYIQPISNNDSVCDLAPRPEAGADEDGSSQAANVKIRVKNSETLDEFSGTAYLNP